MSTLDKVLKNKIIDDIQEIKEDINILNEGLEEVNEEVDSEDTPAKSQILYMKEDGDSIPEGIKLIDWNKEDGIFKVIKLSNPNATYHLHQTHIKEDNITTYSQFLFGDGNVRKRTGVVEESNCPKFNPQPEWGEWESLIEDEQPEEPITPEIYSDYKNGDLVLCKEFTSNPKQEIRPYTDFESMSDDDKSRIIGVIVDADEKIFVKCKWNSRSWIYWRGPGSTCHFTADFRFNLWMDDRDSLNNIFLSLNVADDAYKPSIIKDIKYDNNNSVSGGYGIQFVSENNFIPTIYDLFKFSYVPTDYNKLPIEIFLQVSNMPEDSCFSDNVFGQGNKHYATFLSCNAWYNENYHFGALNNIFLKKTNNIQDSNVHVTEYKLNNHIAIGERIYFFQIFDKINIK